MEAKLKHLELISNIITRMGNNSFLLKGWSVTLVVAIIALSKDGLNCYVISGAILVVVFFGLLDGYYLSQERYFRMVYKTVSKKETIDFRMVIEERELSETERLEICKTGWISSTFSRTIILFYGGLLISIIFLALNLIK